MGPQLKRALPIVLKTKQYVAYRAGVYGALSLAVIVYLALLGLIGTVFGAGAFWVLLVVSIGMAVLLGLGGFLGEYFLFRLKVGHIALITEIISEGSFPTGISQVKWVRGRVMHYFSGLGSLARIRPLLRDALRAIDRTLFDSSAVLPIPGIEGRMKCAQHIVDLSQGYMEEAVIAYAFKTKKDNIADAIRKGLALYCQCWKEMLGQAVILTLTGYAFALVAAVVFLTPLGIIAILVPSDWIIFRFAMFAIGVFLGLAAKWAFYDPVASTAVVLSFYEESEILETDPEWERRLDESIEPFREIGEQAIAAQDNAPSPQPGPEE